MSNIVKPCPSCEKMTSFICYHVSKKWEDPTGPVVITCPDCCPWDHKKNMTKEQSAKIADLLIEPDGPSYSN